MKPSFLLLLVLAGGSLWPQSLWRDSDSLGDDLGSARSLDRGKGWFLHVEPRKGGEKRTLVHDGREESVRVADLDASGRLVRARELRGGEAIWEVTYDPASGLPLAETSFQDNEPAETAQLEFDRRVLVRRTVHDGAGKLLYTDTLDHWPDGTLRRLERDGTAGSLADAAWTYGASGGLTGAWTVSEEDRAKDEHREWIFSPRKTEETLVAGSDPVWSRVTDWLESGAAKEVQTDLLTSRVEKRLQDPQGRTTEDVVTEKGGAAQTQRWSYDAQGRITQSSVDSARGREEWAYTYRDDGMTVVRLARDGVLTQEEVLKAGEKVSVSLYDRGSLFLVENWDGGKKVKETYYRNGTVIRERTP